MESDKTKEVERKLLDKNGDLLSIVKATVKYREVKPEPEGKASGVYI